MLEIGPTHGQAQILRDCGEDPAEFRNMPRPDIIAFLRRRIPTPRANPEAVKETWRKKRMEQIRSKGIQVGTLVDLVRKDGVRAERDKLVVRITDDGFVCLEGMRRPSLPQYIVPTGNGRVSLE